MGHEHVYVESQRQLFPPNADKDELAFRARTDPDAVLRGATRPEIEEDKGFKPYAVFECVEPDCPKARIVHVQLDQEKCAQLYRMIGTGQMTVEQAGGALGAMLLGIDLEQREGQHPVVRSLEGLKKVSPPKQTRRMTAEQQKRLEEQLAREAQRPGVRHAGRVT